MDPLVDGTTVARAVLITGSLAAVNRYIFDGGFSVYFAAAGIASLASGWVQQKFPEAYAKARKFTLIDQDPVSSAAAALALFAAAEQQFSTRAMLSWDGAKVLAAGVVVVWASNQIAGYFVNGSS